MPTTAGPELKKVTLNLFKEDVVAAEAHFGHGWSEVLREHWHSYMTTTLAHRRTRRTLGDLDHG